MIKGAANEREKIRQPTCLSANLRLTKTLAPLARNYKIRLSCSSPTPTRQFLIIFCGQIVPTWANIASVVSGGILLLRKYTVYKNKYDYN